MFCSYCGAQNLNASVFCSTCGRSIGEPQIDQRTIILPEVRVPTPSPPINHPAGQAESQELNNPSNMDKFKHFPNSPFKRQLTWWGGGRIVFILALTYFIVLGSSKTPLMNFIDPSILGAWLGHLALPLLIACFVAWRKSPWDWNRFTVWFFWAGLLIPVIIFNSKSAEERANSKPKTTNEQVSQLMKEAAHGGPPANPSTSPQEVENAIARECMRDMIELSKTTAMKHSAADDTASAELYSGQSFSSQNDMRIAMQFIDTTLAIDQAAEAEVGKILARTRAKIFATNWAEDHKRAWWKGFGEEFESTRRLREQLIRLEGEWGEATHELYRYALEHSDQILVKAGTPNISDETVLQQFNSRLTAAVSSRERLVALQEKYEALRKSGLKQIGLSDKDIGLE